MAISKNKSKSKGIIEETDCDVTLCMGNVQDICLHNADEPGDASVLSN